MHPGEVAALIAAGAFVMLVLILAVPILRLRHTVDAATRAINEVTERTSPLLGDVDATVKGVNEALGQMHIDVPIVVRLDGTNAEEGRKILQEAAPPNLYVEPTMLDAARKAVELAA